MTVYDKMSKFLSIGYRIASIRNAFHLSQTKFADSIGISRSFLSELENGITKPSLPILFTIEYKYGYNYKWILTGDGHPYFNSATPPLTMPITGRELPDRVVLYWWSIVERIFMEGNKDKVDALKAQIRALDPKKTPSDNK